MTSQFYTKHSEQKFIDKLKENIGRCTSCCFLVSFIKKPGQKLLAPNLEAALARGRIITSTYLNFTDLESLLFFYDLQSRYPDQLSGHLDRECLE